MRFYTASQYNLPPLGARGDRKGERVHIPAHFPDPVVRRFVEPDLALIARSPAALDWSAVSLRTRRHALPVVCLSPQPATNGNRET